MTRKGIILAGGSGTRLYPVTQVVSKQLLPVYDKPMIYYPLSTLMLAGIRDILLISTPEDTPRFAQLLGDGARWGLDIRYAVQPSPDGLAQAFIIGRDFIGSDRVACWCSATTSSTATTCSRSSQRATASPRARRSSPTRSPIRERYGVAEFDRDGRVVSLEEKPQAPKSRYAVTGLYFYDNRVVDIARDLAPSARGELEITDVNRQYLEWGALACEVMGRGMAWLDTGTHESLLEASQYIETIERRQGLKIACPEEIAYRMGYIDAAQLRAARAAMAKNGYGQYLLRLLDEPDGRLMRVEPTAIPDVLLIEPQVFGDARGFFFESWNRARVRRGRASTPSSCRTTIRARTAACCAGCTIRSSTRRASSCA